jgi:hypothetical protein
MSWWAMTSATRATTRRWSGTVTRIYQLTGRGVSPISRSYESSNREIFLNTNLTCCQVPCNFDKIRDHSRAGGIAPGAASIEHLHANLVADQENCIIHVHFKVEAGEA